MSSVQNSDIEFDLTCMETAMIASDLVLFDDIQTHYQPHDDIVVIYQLGPQYQPSSNDWVGLYKQGWTDATDALTFEWAPNISSEDKFPHLRTILFQAIDMQVNMSTSK